jgi:hypothetical protein
LITAGANLIFVAMMEILHFFWFAPMSSFFDLKKFLILIQAQNNWYSSIVALLIASCGLLPNL